jgi:hypothetical protein
MGTSTRMLLVTAKLKKTNYPKLLARAWVIYNAWLANAQALGTPTPSLPAYLALLDAFDGAQHAAAGSKDSLIIETRNAKALLVVMATESWETFLQGLCDASPATAGQLIAAGGMFVRGTGKRVKALLGLSLVPGQPGTVAANANGTLLTGGSRKRPMFNWETSGDGGKTITNGGSTPHVQTTFANVPLLSTLYVRVSVTLGKTTGDWSQWVSVLVH